MIQNSNITQLQDLSRLPYSDVLEVILEENTTETRQGYRELVRDSALLLGERPPRILNEPFEKAAKRMARAICNRRLSRIRAAKLGYDLVKDWLGFLAGTYQDRCPETAAHLSEMPCSKRQYLILLSEIERTRR